MVATTTPKIRNKKARHNFAILETIEAGLVLVGSEVKSLRDGKANIDDAFGRVRDGEAWLFNMHIGPYEKANQFGHDTRRPRKLLLKKREIDKFLGRAVEKGSTLVPLAVYFKWAASEEKRAIGEWRRQFRGDAQVRDDKDITDADIANSNLALWGDPGSNRILARIANRLPVKWTADGVVLGSKTYAVATHAPILIFPNPLNPKKYVVLNSGFTFREADYLSNARQTPKLPDYAIVDITVPPDTRFPGKIVQAGFFNEDWSM